MRDEVMIKIAGEAGQGMKTVGSGLSGIFKRAGYNIFANMNYMSRIRGGNNFFQLRVSKKPVYSLREKYDITIALDKNSVGLHKENLSPDGILILDKERFGISGTQDNFFDAPLYRIASETGGGDIFVNSVSSGLIGGIAKLEFRFVEEVLKSVFSGKTEEIIGKNIKAAYEGYRFANENFRPKSLAIEKETLSGNYLISGNEAIALGAIYAGCKFYTAYPMTPSTGIMDIVAHYADRFNILVEQAEDEIAAINMAIGASFVGCRSMVGTSGGGFALMQEGVSLAGMTETPIVIVEAQRPAPATGFPTRTEQADLNFVIHSGHGEFAKVVYSPGTIEEAFYLTLKAFDTAEKYQIPVFIMTDQHLADSYRNVEKFGLDKIKIERHIIPRDESDKITEYKRYKLTESGVSPRAIPSWIKDVIYADSDEHTEEGHITEDAKTRESMVEKRFHRKLACLSKEYVEPVTDNLDSAETVFIGFGSTYGVVKEACEMTGDKKIGFIHLPQVWPFPAQNLCTLLKIAKKIITVENNAGGQLARLIRRETGINVHGAILKYNGRPFTVDELKERMLKADR